MNSTEPVALWVEPATRSERLVAISSVTLIGDALALSIGHLLLVMTGLVPISTGEWGFADVSYLALMALMSALVLVHASLGEHALRPRTMGTPPTLVASLRSSTSPGLRPRSSRTGESL